MAKVTSVSLVGLAGSLLKHTKSNGERGGTALTLKEYCSYVQFASKVYPTYKRSPKQDIHREIWALVDKAYGARSQVIDEAWRTYYFQQRKIPDTLQTQKRVHPDCSKINIKRHLSWFAYWMKKHMNDQMLDFYGNFIGLELELIDVVLSGDTVFFTVRVQQKDDFPTEEDLTPEHILRRT